MRLSEALKVKLMDVRLRDKLLTEGKLTKKQIEDFLSKLADERDNATYTDASSVE
jgi:hypothetical protein